MISVVCKEDVLGLEIGMYEVEVVENCSLISVSSLERNRLVEHTCNTGEELPSKALDVSTREWHERILLQKVEDALAQEVGDYAYVVSKIETVS